MKDVVFRGALALALLFLACDVLPTNEFEPTGTQFDINPNIHVLSIAGNPDEAPNGPMRLDMTVVSRTSSVESAVLPAGLLFRRRNNQTQHVLLLKAHPVTATTTNRLEIVGGFCCNKKRDAPDVGDTFDIGPVTDNAELQQIVDSLQHKDISRSADMYVVQHAVYMVTDSTGLTQAYIDSIRALPADTTD